MIEIELFDGTIIELPEGTPQDVIQRVVREATATRRAAAEAAPEGAADAPAPGADIPADDLAVPTPTEDAGDTMTSGERLFMEQFGGGTGDVTIDPDANDLYDMLFPESRGQPRPMANRQRPRTPEQAAPGIFNGGPTPEGMPEFNPATQVPPGMRAEYQNVQMFPQSGVWADVNPEGSPERIATQEEALARRDERSRAGGLQGWAYRNFSSNPLVAGTLSGATYGLQDEASEFIDPVVGEAMRQEYNQAREDSPWTTAAGELAGGVANVALTRRIPGVAPLQDRMIGAPLSRSLPYGMVGGAAVGGGYRATTNQPGERMEGVLDPTNIMIDSALGGAFPLAGAAYRGVQGLRSGTPGAIDELGDTLGSFSTTSGPYGVPEYQQLAEQQAIRDYLNTITPSTSLSDRAAMGEAALELGIDLPAGMVTNPQRFEATATDPFTLSRGRALRGDTQARRQLSDRFGETVADNAIPSLPGEAGDRLRASVMGNIDQQIQRLSREYDEFSLPLMGDHELPPNVGETLDEVFARRFAAGSETDEDAAFIGEVVNLVRRNALPEGADAADAADLTGVTWQGLRDARTMLKTQTSNFQRGQQLTPKQQDMRTMEQSLTDAMEDIIRKNAPEGEADKLVEQFYDLDRRYAIAQETRREMDDLLGGESTSVMNTLGKAMQRGGETSRETIRKLRENASPSDWDNAKAVLLHQIGTDADGAFDPTKFGSQWQKLSPDAISEVFSPAHRADLNSIATIARNLPRPASELQRDSRSMANLLFSGAGIAGVATGSPWVAAGAALMGGLRVMGARRLTNPLTAKHVKDLFSKLDAVERAQTDAARALNTLRLNRATEGFEAATGIALPGIRVNPVGASASRTTGQQNVVGEVGD